MTEFAFPFKTLRARHLWLRMWQVIHASDDNWALRQPIDLYTKWEILIVYTRKVSPRANTRERWQSRYMYTRRAAYPTAIQIYCSLTIIVTISFSIILSAPPHPHRLANNFVPKTAPLVSPNRIPAQHLVNFPSGRVSKIPFNRNFECAFNPSPITSSAKHPFLQQSSLSRANVLTKNKISLCSRYEPEACDGRIQKSKHSRPNCR